MWRLTDLAMYYPLTRKQWLICTAVILAFCLFLNRFFGVPWFRMSYSVTGILFSGWVSYAAYLENTGRPMFSRGRRQPPRQSQVSRHPRTIQADPRSRMAKGKTGRIPKGKKSVAPARPLLNAQEAALMRRLINLTHDQDTARRLALGVRSKYPGQSRAWQLEKAIADLERDRLR